MNTKILVPLFFLFSFISVSAALNIDPLSRATSSGTGTYIVNANVNDSTYWNGHAYSALISQWTNDLGYINTSVGGGSFNSTYQTWTLINQTLGGINYCDARIAGNNSLWLSTFNSTYEAGLGGGSSFNSTYEGFWTTYGANWYNHTLAVYNAWNTIWVNTFNSTYDNLIRNPITFNSTYEAGLGGGGAFNITYQNKTNAGTCPTGQVVQNTTANNGGVQCVAVTNGGTTTSVIGQPLLIRQLAQLSTNNNTVWSPTDLAFTIEPNRKHTMECDILFSGDAATTGMVINWTTNITSSNMNNIYQTWSSATAPVVISNGAFGTVMTGTGSGAAIVQPSKFISDFNSISGGELRMLIRSEVSGSNTVIHRGSTCKLYDRVNYTTVPVSNPTGWYPATTWQAYDDTTNNATTQWNNTMLNFTLETGKKYNLNCNLLTNATISTTGVVINLTTDATTSNVNIIYNTWSSGVAPVVLSATAFETALIGTGSAAANKTISQVFADFETTSAGTLKLMYKSEVALSNVTMGRGSTCRLYDIT